MPACFSLASWYRCMTDCLPFLPFLDLRAVDSPHFGFLGWGIGRLGSCHRILGSLPARGFIGLGFGLVGLLWLSLVGLFVPVGRLFVRRLGRFVTGPGERDDQGVDHDAVVDVPGTEADGQTVAV